MRVFVLLLLLRHALIPKQGTKHLMTDTMVLPGCLLVSPTTIRRYFAARETERHRPVSDLLLSSETIELAPSKNSSI